ncbi:MAG: hypothetical protein IJ062_02595 [Firmicutes bacterium]|nr:hypothetical protein [Bacillota bacterium]
MNGPESSKRAKRGRPKKKTNYNRKEQIDGLVSEAVLLIGIPFDDRDVRPIDAPTIESVAKAMNTTPVKIRRLLITGDYYSTEKSRMVQSMLKNGLTVDEISKKTGLGKASVYSYIPYRKGAYMLPEPTLYAEQTRLFRKRKKACEILMEYIDCTECSRYLWETIIVFENYSFCMENGKRFKYSIDGDWLCCDGIKISKQRIIEAFSKVRKIQKVNGHIREDKALEICGLKELIVIFLRIGACKIS